MNSITREIIERELEHEQGRLSRWEEDIDRQRGVLSRLERERDEIVDRIGALKEDLGRREVTTTLHVHTDGIQKAMKTFQERLDKLYA